MTHHFTNLPLQIEAVLRGEHERLSILQPCCQKIIQIINDETVTAKDVGSLITQEPALAAKIIKAANSPIYHTTNPIKTIERAVTIIGFDAISAIAMASNLIACAKGQSDAAIANLCHLLTRAFLAANQAHTFGQASACVESEELYTAALFYSFGELILANTMPDFYAQWLHVRSQSPDNLVGFEQTTLGAPLALIAAAIAQQWNFPPSLIEVIEHQPQPSPQSRATETNKARSIVGGTNAMSQCLLAGRSPERDAAIDRLLTDLEALLRLPRKDLGVLVAKSLAYTMHASELVALDPRYLTIAPAAGASPVQTYVRGWRATVVSCAAKRTTFGALNAKDPAHARFASPEPFQQQTRSPISQIDSGQRANAPSTQQEAMYDFLRKFTAINAAGLSPIDLFKTATEGLKAAAQFERVILTLLNPQGSRLEAKLGLGAVDGLLPLFHPYISEPHFLLRILTQTEPLVVDLRREHEAGHLPAHFAERWGLHPCLAGPILVKSRPIGILLADRGRNGSLAEHDHAHFVMILTLLNANLAKFAR